MILKYTDKAATIKIDNSINEEICKQNLDRKWQDMQANKHVRSDSDCLR